MAGPQTAKDWDKPGEYSLAVRVLKSEVNPGEEVVLEVYVTGYGEIRGPKFMFSPPPSLIDVAQSKVIHGVKSPAEGTKVTPYNAIFGSDKDEMSDTGFAYRLGGLVGEGWEEGTIFWDHPYPSDGDTQSKTTPKIASEKKLPEEDPENAHAPIEIHLKTNKRRLFQGRNKGTPPGAHSLQFYLTYCNGNQWKTDRQSVNIVVPNWFKRHEIVTWSAATLGVLFALGSLSLNTAVNWDHIQPVFDFLGGLLQKLVDRVAST